MVSCCEGSFGGRAAQEVDGGELAQEGVMAVPLLWRMRAKLGALTGMLVLLGMAFLATGGFLLYASHRGLAVLNPVPPFVSSDASVDFRVLWYFPALGVLAWFIARRNKGGGLHGREAV